MQVDEHAAYAPELRARSIVSRIDHRPSSSSGGRLPNVSGAASSKPAQGPSATGPDFCCAFLASARFSAICSFRLKRAGGSGGGSLDSDLGVGFGLDGDARTDAGVRVAGGFARVVVGVEVRDPFSGLVGLGVR